MARNYAALPHEYLEEMDTLSDAEFGRLCRALLQYSMAGKEGQLQGAEKVVWKRVKMQEDRFQKSYEQMVDAKRSAGKKGASKRWHSMADDGTAMADDGKNAKTETETETETETNTPPPNGGRSKRAREARFIPPTLEEVTAYVQERGSRVDPQSFIDFYASKGWMIGKTPMKDWKAACRNAESWDRWDKTEPDGSRRDRGASSTDFQPDLDRIQKNADWLDGFLGEQRAKGGGQT